MESDTNIYKGDLSGAAASVSVLKPTENAGFCTSESGACATNGEKITNNSDNNIENPFRRSSVMMRSPPLPEACNKSKVVHDKGLETPLGRCLVKTPVTSVHTQNNCSSNKNVAILGEKINKLMTFLKGRTNVHKEIVSCVREIQASYLQVIDDLEKIPAKSDKILSVDKESQTEKDLRPPMPTLETPKRRREPLSPKGNNSKKKKEEGKQNVAKKQEEGNKNVEDVVPTTSKNARVEEESERTSTQWVKVQTQAKKKASRRKPVRPDAIVIHTNGETSYADILRKVKNDPKLEVLGQNVKTIRKSAKGELLLELSKASHQRTGEFRHTVAEVLGASAEVRSLSQEIEIEIRDVDEVTSKEEVYAALVSQGEAFKTLHLSAIKSLRRAYGGTQTATVGLSATLANGLVKAAKIRIGWVVCRIREKIKPRRCFKCLDYGHTAARCRSTNDFSDHCFRCGDKGHKIQYCRENPKCLLCRNSNNNSDHVTGATSCPYYKTARGKLLSRK